MLNINLDDESERYLVEILQQEKTTVSELIKGLLRERLSMQQPQKTVLERMGGVPGHLISDGNLSDRDSRRETVLDRIKASHQKQA